MTTHVALDLVKRTVFVKLRYSLRATSLRLSILNGQARLTAPAGLPLFMAKSFLEKKKQWLEKHLVPTSVKAISYDQAVEVFGNQYTIQYDPLYRKTIKNHGLILWSGVEAQCLRDVLIAFCKKEAKPFFLNICQAYAEEIGVAFVSITIRDTQTRWGSCSSRGGLNFNWRLALAPLHVSSYIAAHEVAHLKEMNHGRDFWKIVSHLHPSFKQAKQWLKEHGASLMQK